MLPAPKRCFVSAGLDGEECEVKILALECVEMI